MEALHKKTGNMYRIITENHKVQIDNIWHDAVCYVSKEDPAPGTPALTFTRTKKDFDKAFIRVKPVVPKLGTLVPRVAHNLVYEG